MVLQPDALTIEESPDARGHRVKKRHESPPRWEVADVSPARSQQKWDVSLLVLAFGDAVKESSHA